VLPIKHCYTSCLGGPTKKGDHEEASIVKIEIAESLLRSWLRHVRGCEFAELNWKASPEWLPKSDEITELFDTAHELWPEAFGKNSYEQLLRQAEVDVLGLSFYDNRLYFIDVAFHLGGLNYGDKLTTAMRVYKKLVRSALIAKRYFPDQTSSIYFVSPFTNANVCSELDVVKDKLQEISANDEKINFDFVLTRSEFKSEVMEPLLSLGNGVADTSELFLRSWQLIEPFFNIQLQGNDSEVLTPKKDTSRTPMPTSEVNRTNLLISALYLAKFGHLNRLGFGNQTRTIKSLADIIGCSANSLKGFRDRYDRYVESPRVGYDLPLSDELSVALDKYDDFSELELRAKLPT